MIFRKIGTGWEIGADGTRVGTRVGQSVFLEPFFHADSGLTAATILDPTLRCIPIELNSSLFLGHSGLLEWAEFSL